MYCFEENLSMILISESIWNAGLRNSIINYLSWFRMVIHLHTEEVEFLDGLHSVSLSYPFKSTANYLCRLMLNFEYFNLIWKEYSVQKSEEFKCLFFGQWKWQLVNKLFLSFSIFTCVYKEVIVFSWLQGNQ